MTDVAFHFNVAEKQPYVCRLLRKAVNSGARVVVVGGAEELARLDRGLWEFAPYEFLAHCRADATATMLAASPIVLTESVEHPALADWPRQVLLNWGREVPPGFDQFQRLIEIVSYDEQDRQGARQRWKFYAESGLPLKRHDLAASPP